MTRLSSPHARPPRIRILLATALLSACQLTPGDHDFEVSTGIHALPGIGSSVGFAQRMWESPTLRIDFETEFIYQALDETVSAAGETGDDLSQFRFGVRFRSPGTDNATWVGRVGGTWMRFQGDPVYLDDALDYGGGYIGVGYEFPVGSSWTMGPHFTAHILTSEGSGDAGVVPEVAWRIALKL